MIKFQLPQTRSMISRSAKHWGIQSDQVAEVCADLLAFCILEAVADGLQGNPRPAEENALQYFKDNLHKALSARSVSPAHELPLHAAGLAYANLMIRQALFGTTLTLTRPNEMAAQRYSLRGESLAA